TGPQSIHILRGVRQQQDEPGRFSICSRQAAVVQRMSNFRRWLFDARQGMEGYTQQPEQSNLS
ncbi:hypothetical protein ACRWWJ_24215, partial [Escherichia coli]